jgi:thioesterase domain-containing protein
MRGDTKLFLNGVQAPEAENSPGQSEGLYCFPCSIPQQACWYADRLRPGASINNIAVRFQLRGSLFARHLEQAIQCIIARHEVLRSTFVYSEGQPRQLVHPLGAFEMELLDLREFEPATREAEAERIAAGYARLPFDLEKGPLLRAQLIHLEEQESMLLVNMHHAVSDGWSVGIFTDELGEFYSALVEDRPAALPDLEIQYADYAVWQQDALAHGELDSQLQFWQNRLRHFRPMELPVDIARPDGQTSESTICSRVLPRSLTNALQSLGSRTGQSLFVNMLGAVAAMLHHESGQTDLALRTITAGRNRVELERLIGWFANPIVLRCDLSGDPLFGQMTARLDQTVVEASSFQDIPFEQVIDQIEPGPVPPRQPLFQFNLIFQKDFVRPWERGGLAMTALPSKSVGSFIDMNFFLVERADGWRASVEVSRDVYRPSTGDVLLEKFERVLAAIVTNPDARLSQLLTGIPLCLTGAPKVASVSLTTPTFVAPRNKMEREITEIWEKALRKSPIGVTENFFDLGGYSLLATQILAKIQKRFAHKLALGDLFIDPTIAATAARISEAIGTDNAPGPNLLPVIHVQPEGSRDPFIMVAADHWFRSLALHTGLDQPFVGISFQPYKGLAEEPPRETVIADVIATIQSIQPKGPYFLGGWCADGITAFEVARVLQANGEEIGMVAVFDAMNPEYAREFRSLHQAAVRVSKSAWGLLRNSRRQRKEFVEGVTSIAHRVTDRALSLFRPSYVCAPVNFPIVVLRPPVGEIEDGDLGWRRVAGDRLQVAEIAGDHVSIFREPDVRELGAALRTHLIQAQDALRPRDFLRPETSEISVVARSGQ